MNDKKVLLQLSLPDPSFDFVELVDVKEVGEDDAVEASSVDDSVINFTVELELVGVEDGRPEYTN